MSVGACKNALHCFIVKSPVVESLHNSVIPDKDGRLFSLRVAKGAPSTFRKCILRTASTLDDRSFVDFPSQRENALAQSLKDSYDDSVRERLKYWIIPVATPEEALAAATLRAGLFFRYSEAGCQASRKLPFLYRSEDQLNAQIRSEYNRKAKMDFLGMKVTALLAVCNHSEQSRLESYEQASTHLYSTPPPEVPCRGSDYKREPLLAIGTLDLQVGAQLPGESLEGRHPLGNANNHRGYIFNLCVHRAARRNGVASSLMKVSTTVAQLMGVKVLYIHVEEGNDSAATLYRSLGYNLEQEESEEVAKSSGRPRRSLLRLDVPFIPDIAL